MTKDRHFMCLKNMYLSAPINRIYRPSIEIANGTARIEVAVKEDFFHSGGAVHGSVYFKMLEDAAFFAANSLETEAFVLTTAFTTYLTRPISGGTIVAVGKVVSQQKAQFIAESVAYNASNKEIARGSGVFVKGKIPLTEAVGYDG